MIAGLQRLTGSFPTNGHLNSVNNVMYDGPGGGHTDGVAVWSTGMTAIAPIQSIRPTLMERWTLYGFVLTIVGYIDAGNVITRPFFARFGDLWGGLLVDSPLRPTSPFLPQQAGGAQLPADLSTFAKLWSGDSDPQFPLAVSGAPSTVPTQRPISTTLLFPQPIKADTTAQFAMALVLTPTLSTQAYVAVLSASYSLIYDVET